MRRSSTRPLHRRLPHIFTVLPTARQTDNAVWLDGQRQCRCARQPEVQSKVDILSTPPAMAAVQVEHRLNIARSHESDRENGYENRSPVFSYERFPSFCIIHYRFITLHQYRTSMQFCGQYTNVLGTNDFDEPIKKLPGGTLANSFFMNKISWHSVCTNFTPYPCDKW